MLLAGTYELTIDNKNRLSIPFAIRRSINDDVDGQSFWMLPGRRPGTLSMYPERYFKRVREHQPDDDLLSDQAYAYREFEYSQSVLLEPDAQGRVLIPDRLLKRVGFTKDVVLTGVRDHLELWRLEDFDKFETGMWPAYTEERARALEEMNRLGPATVSATTPGAGTTSK
jgi:MraZ protein